MDKTSEKREKRKTSTMGSSSERKLGAERSSREVGSWTSETRGARNTKGTMKVNVGWRSRTGRLSRLTPSEVGESLFLLEDYAL